jgi:hypothetical protein
LVQTGAGVAAEPGIAAPPGVAVLLGARAPFGADVLGDADVVAVVLASDDAGPCGDVGATAVVFPAAAAVDVGPAPGVVAAARSGRRPRSRIGAELKSQLHGCPSIVPLQ